MAIQKPIVLINGELSQLPVGDILVGDQSTNVTVPNSEGLSAGDFVNLYKDSGITYARKASAQSGDREANGYVLQASLSGNIAQVFLEGINTAVVGMSIGSVWLSTTNPGGVQDNPPVTGSFLCQEIGIATSSTKINFLAGTAVMLS
jgi:hypothetical protein